MAGGTVYATAAVDEICERAHEVGLKVHLDGARIFNAAAALGESVASMTRNVDSVMFCLSRRTLAAPVRVDGARVAGVYCQGARLPEDVWRRHAASGGDRGCGVSGAREIACSVACRSQERSQVSGGCGQDSRICDRSGESADQHCDFRLLEDREDGGGMVRTFVQARSVGAGYGVAFGAIGDPLRRWMRRASSGRSRYCKSVAAAAQGVAGLEYVAETGGSGGGCGDFVFAG